MTVEEYLSPRLFPLTGQPGLDLDQQMQLDAVNFDEYLRDKRAHVPMDDRTRAVGRELEAKHAARESVLRQRAGRRGAAGAPQGPDGRPLG